MVPLENIVEFFYFFFGSLSIGYFFLRIGWPKSRTLETNLKVGWSIVFGTIFSIIIGTATLLETISGTSPFGTNGTFVINALAGITITTIALTLKRKFLTGRKIRIIVPKEIVRANIAAEKAMNRLESDKFFVSAKLDEEKVQAIKKALEEKQKSREKKEEQPEKTPKKNIAETNKAGTEKQKPEGKSKWAFKEENMLLAEKEETGESEETTSAPEKGAEIKTEETPEEQEETAEEKYEEGKEKLEALAEETEEGKELEFLEEIPDFEEENREANAQEENREKLQLQIEEAQEGKEETLKEEKNIQAAEEKVLADQNSEAGNKTEKMKEIISEKISLKRKESEDERNRKAKEEWENASKAELAALKELAKKQKINKIKEELEKTIKTKKSRKGGSNG